MNTLELFKSVKTFVFDMDGVLTDGKVWVLNSTDWIRNMHIRDGYGIKEACEKGYRVIIISGSESLPIKKRLHLLGVKDIYMSVADKKVRLLKCIKKYQLNTEEILYMGDDTPDYTCMQMVGVPTCPADAISDLKSVAKYISPIKGGEGCVRDVIEKVLKLNDHWEVR